MMNRYFIMVILFLSLLFFLGIGRTSFAKEPSQYLLVNLHRHELTREGLQDIKQKLAAKTDSNIRIGVSMIYSYLQIPKDDDAAEERFLQQIKADLALVQETELPMLVQLDGEQWWNARPDLWNWWDPTKPGFDPKNAENVEWTDWGPEHAVKISWRNWGRQLRVLPAPNLMSPAYSAAWKEKMDKVVPVILDWVKSLPDDKKYLFVGIKVGWESSVGLNAWYYPNGNDLLDKPEKEDPQAGLDGTQIPGRGVQTIGFAACTSAGIRKSGQIEEADLAEVARRHLENLCKKASELGVPRDKLFTHGAGWKDEELLYDATVNKYSCPGWSFYNEFAVDPGTNMGVKRALKTSDAPYWAVTEWLLFHDIKDRWVSALEKSLSDPKCRYVCIFNWMSIINSPNVHEAIREFLASTD
jgi:hypothetical protein